MYTPWLVDVFTLYPQAFPSTLGVGVVGRAHDQQLWQLRVHALRHFGVVPHARVDDTPSGGGAGMVLRADVALNALRTQCHGQGGFNNRVLVYPSPRGTPFTADMAQEWCALAGMIVLCGRFEGVDERIFQHLPVHEVCVGDAVLCGGEAAALLMIEATVRLRSGVAGNSESLRHESFAHNTLEHAQYTRPAVVEGLAIPEVLQQGHHAHIAAARQADGVRITKARRPDLVARWPQKQ